MVNIRLKPEAAAHRPAGMRRYFPEKSRVSSVNEFLSKRFEFSDHLRHILIECVQKREQPLQSCLLACVMRHPSKDDRRAPSEAPEREQG
jgi:hypothetical protein